MSTVFTPQSEKVQEIMINIAGAQFLRFVLGDNEGIIGVGCDIYTTAKESRKYAKKINDFLDKNPGHKNYEWLKRKAKFFELCSGFWQS